MKARVRQEGFSAMEITVVVLIIAAIAAIAIPNVVSATRSYKLQIAADALAQQLNRTRQEAVRINNQMRIQVNTTTSQLDSNRDTNFDSSDEDPITLTSSATITPSPTGASNVVTYTSRGEMPLSSTSSPAPAFKVVYSGKMRVVSIDPRGAVTVSTEQVAS